MSRLEPFNLEEQIAVWRGVLLSSRTIGADEAAELEDHLRAKVENLTALGRSEEDAFMTAAQAIGGVDALAAEYGKVQTPFSNKHLQWAFAGYLSVTKARPMRLTQPVGLFGVGAIIALLIHIAEHPFSDEPSIYLNYAYALLGLEALNQLLAYRYAPRAVRKAEPARYTLGEILINVACFLLPPLGLLIWLLIDHKLPQNARRAFRSSVRGLIVLLIAAQYLHMALLVGYAVKAIGLARLSPLDPVKVERRYQEQKVLNRLRREQGLSTNSDFLTRR